MTPLIELVLNGTQATGNLSLILATLWLINNDFAKFTTSAITMGSYAINRENRLYHNDLLNEVFQRAMVAPEIKFFIEGDEREEVEEELLDSEELQEEFMRKYSNREKSIWFLDSFTSYRNFEIDLLNPNRHFHRNGFFILIYTGTERERLSNIKEIFRRLFSLYVTNVNVLLVTDKVPHLYTYFPFAQNKCHSSLPEYFISFSDIEKNFTNFAVNKEIFPSKVQNMHGCELVVATWHYPPYIYIDYDAHTGEFTRLHGIEGMLITLLSELMNFKIRIKEPVPHDRGDIFPNGTATGATQMIIDADANITIVCFLHNKQRSEVMQASESYITIPYVLAMPQGRKMSPFKRLIKPFRYIIWLCFSFSLIFAILLIYYLRYLGQLRVMEFVYGKGNRIPFTNLLSTLFGGPALNNFPYKTFARYILTIWMLYTFVLRSAYSAALFTLLQDGRTRITFSSLREVVDMNYTIYAFAAVESVIKLATPGANTGTIDAKNPATKLFERISSPSNDDDKIALCLLEYSIRSYNQMNPNRRVDVLSQPLITAPIVFYMRQHSFLNYRTKELILRILAAGLMERYESFYLYETKTSSRDQREPIKLSVWLLYGIFSVYAVFLVFSFIIFLLEVASLKSVRCKIVLDFMNF